MKKILEIEDGFEMWEKGLDRIFDMEFECRLYLWVGDVLHGDMINILSGLMPFWMEAILWLRAIEHMIVECFTPSWKKMMFSLKSLWSYIIVEI